MNVRVLVLYTLVSALSTPVFERFTSPFLRDAGVEVIWIGMFAGVVNAASAVSAPLSGWLTDTFGRKIMLITGRVLRATGLLLPRLPWLLVGAIILGLSNVSQIAFAAMTAESVPSQRRASAFAVMGATRNIVTMVVPGLAGLLADYSGVRVALLVALIPLLASVGIGTKTSETLSSEFQPGTRSSMFSALHFMRTSEGRACLLTGVMWFLIGIEMGTLGPIWSLYVQDRFGTSYAGLGVVAMVSGAGAVIANLTGGRAGDTIGRAPALMLSFGLGAISWTLVPYATSVSIFALLAFITSLVMAFAEPSWDAVCTGTAPKRIRGGVTGIYAACTGVGTAIGAPLAAWLYGHSITVPFRLLSIAEVVLCLLTYFGMRSNLRGFSRLRSDDND